MTEHQLILVLLFCPALQNRWKQRSRNASEQKWYMKSSLSLDRFNLLQKITAFWDMVQCILIEVDRRFRGAYWFHHQVNDSGYHDETFLTSARLYTSTRLRAKSQKDVIFILVAIRTRKSRVLQFRVHLYPTVSLRFYLFRCSLQEFVSDANLLYQIHLQ